MANERRLIDVSKEVVLCKDCKYSVAPKCQKAYCEEKGILKCDKPGGIAFNRRVYFSDFCSYGKKRVSGT